MGGGGWSGCGGDAGPALHNSTFDLSASKHPSSLFTRSTPQLKAALQDGTSNLSASEAEQLLADLQH